VLHTRCVKSEEIKNNEGVVSAILSVSEFYADSECAILVLHAIASVCSRFNFIAFPVLPLF